MLDRLAAAIAVAGLAAVDLPPAPPASIDAVTVRMPAVRCAALPRPRMRVRLTVVSDRLPEAGAAIRHLVDAVWQREGLVFEWDERRPGESVNWDGVDVWILASHAPASRLDPAALGAVMFADGQPQRLLRLSFDATIAWVTRHMAGLFRASIEQDPQMTLADSRDLVLRAIGYAAAHEVGHYVLGSRDHASAGLMIAAFPEPVRLDATHLALDASSRETLRHRLAESAQCPEAGRGISRRAAQ
jgi:hypothetical protein